MVSDGISFRNQNNYNGTNTNCSIHDWGYAYGDGLKYNAYQGHIFTTNNGTERMRLERYGKLGLGTTTPQYPLDVNSTTTGFYSTYWNAGNNDGTGYTVPANTNFNYYATNYGQGSIFDLDSNNSHTVSAHFKNGVYFLA